jgi:1,4-alpha-glucan branching enzyme
MTPPPQLKATPGSAPDQPISIYEAALESWMRVPDENNRPLAAAEIAPKLADHVNYLNFTHVQIDRPNRMDARELFTIIDCLRARKIGVVLESAGLTADFPADGFSATAETVFGPRHYPWDMEWTKRALGYFALNAAYRTASHALFTQRDAYAFNASYILPLSHHFVSRQSLLAAMPGDEWQKFANLRLLLAYMYLLPGKKLLFMGSEFGQRAPWQPEMSLDWHIINDSNPHGKMLRWVKMLNQFYREERALHQTDFQPEGFKWIDTSDAGSSVISFLRLDSAGREILLVVLNFTPRTHHNYRVGVPRGGFWAERLNGDAQEFGGSGQGNMGGVEAAPFGWNFQSHSLMLTLPPLAAVVLKAPM